MPPAVPLFPPLPRFRPGIDPTAEQLNNIVEALARVMKLSPASDIGMRAINNQVTIENTAPKKWKARITASPHVSSGSGSGSGSASSSGSSSGSGTGSGSQCPGYSWIEVVRSGCDFVEVGGGRTGSPDAGLPGYENEGNQSVPVGTIVDMWLAADGQSTEFARCCGASGSGSGSGTGSGQRVRVRLVTCVQLISSGSGTSSGSGSGPSSGSGPGPGPGP